MGLREEAEATEEEEAQLWEQFIPNVHGRWSAEEGKEEQGNSFIRARVDAAAML